MKLPSPSIFKPILHLVSRSSGGVEREAPFVRSALQSLLNTPDRRYSVSAGDKERIAVIGSGNWGSVAAKLVATNARSQACFHDEMRMWVYEETLASGEKLTDIINRKKVHDVEGVELCGTLKNVVAIAAGFVDGLGMGNNSKAAIMRIGLNEMIRFSKLLFPTVRDATFESCGAADLITTCFGGRNRKVAEAFARSRGKKSFEELEAELLGGQKLQGVSSAAEVFQVLKARKWEEKFPLFATVHKIASNELPPSAIVQYDQQALKHTSLLPLYQ